MQESQFPRGIETTCAVVVENEQGKILLISSPKQKGKWTLPGGHIEPGEKILEAAVREVKEEVGLDTEAVIIIRHGELINPPDFHRPIHVIYFDCLVKVISGEVFLDSNEAASFVWCTPAEALEMELARGYETSIEGYVEFKSTR